MAGPPKTMKALVENEAEVSRATSQRLQPAPSLSCLAGSRGVLGCWRRVVADAQNGTVVSEIAVPPLEDNEILIKVDHVTLVSRR